MTVDELHRLFIAPELIVVELAAASLHALRRALVVGHPTIERPCAYDLAPIHHCARAVLRSARQLQVALDAYRAAAEDIIQSSRIDDDIPF
jgi:hypothetical protein